VDVRAERLNVEELMTPIGLKLRQLRDAAGLTQQQVAVAAGLSVSIISQIEQGKNADPRGSTLKAIAGALGTTVDELLRDDAPAAADKPAKGTGKK
jgi:transcriptional regulator with XRE-family HTH domain